MSSSYRTAWSYRAGSSCRAACLGAALALLPAPCGTASAQTVAAPAKTGTETILFIRHGEKPDNGLGQLSCKGLNRALALAGLLRAKYGRLDAVFAPDPAHQKPDGEASYDYLRPLATVEPTAVSFGLPVHASLGYTEIDPLRDALLAPDYRDAIVLVGWEHHMINKMVPRLVTALGGDGDRIKAWERDDFDSIWRVTIERSGAETKVAFAVDREGLDNQSNVCPK